MIESIRVNEIFKDCLYKKHELDRNGEPLNNPRIVEGIMITAGLNPDSLNKHDREIGILIEHLPIKFKHGWSFLNMCIDRNGNHWTGNHRTMEELLLLGLATGRVEFCCERSMWEALPGGMPYIKII